MRYNPDAANADLIPDKTWCDAIILESVDSLSKKNNEMIVADFKVYDPKGLHPIIKHWFVADYPGMFKKLCAALGLDYASGNIAAETIKGKSVKVLIRIREDDTGQFRDKNVIGAFTAPDTATQAAPALDPAHVFDANDPALKDEIPF